MRRKDHHCGWQRGTVTELCRKSQRHSRTSQASSPIRRTRRWRLLPSPMPVLSFPLFLVAWVSPSSSPRWITLPRYSIPSLRILQLNLFLIYFSLHAVCYGCFWFGLWLIVWCVVVGSWSDRGVEVYSELTVSDWSGCPRWHRQEGR